MICLPYHFQCNGVTSYPIECFCHWKINTFALANGLNIFIFILYQMQTSDLKYKYECEKNNVFKPNTAIFGFFVRIEGKSIPEDI